MARDRQQIVKDAWGTLGVRRGDSVLRTRIWDKVERMGMLCAVGGVDVDLSPQRLSELLAESLGKLGRRERVLAVPPDITRLHSQAGSWPAPPGNISATG